jgi:XTP/dITP diphosphohydrolase
VSELTPLQRAVEVMDQLRSPGGCPWDAAQTHDSLTRYLVEETYEVLEAIETGDPVLLREELGDLLLQVLFHARIAQEGQPGFGIDDVARDLVDKLVRRHPHVFARTDRDHPATDHPATDPGALNEAWERGKAAEKKRTSAVDGVPIAQPALALAAKLVARAGRAGLDGPAVVDIVDAREVDADGIGYRLLAIVREAVAAGVDPETELRTAAHAYRRAILALEAAR